MSGIWRISDRRSFAVLRAHGTRHRSGPLVVTALVQPDDLSRPRVAYAVGTRLGSAVARNRVRRQLRAAVSELSPRPGAYLVSVGPDAATLSYDDLRDHLRSALHAAGAMP